MAGSRSLGTLTLDLIAKIGGFTGPLDQAGRVADARLKAIERRAKQFGVALGAALSAAGLAISAGVKQAIDRADALNDLNQRLGISAEALSGFGYAAKQTGTDIDGLGIGLKKLSKNLAEALDPKSSQAKLFDALDIEPIDKATGKLKALETILPEIADRFKAMRDETLEAALAQQIFGKSGVDLIEFLNQGSDGIERMRAHLRELGGELSGEDLQAADQFNDKLADLKTATDGLFASLARDLLPHLDSMVTSMIDASREGSELRGIVSGLSAVFEYLAEICGVIDDTWRGMVSSGIALFNVLDNLAKVNPSSALGRWIAGGDSMAENWRETGTAIDQATEALGQYGQKAASAARVDPRIMGWDTPASAIPSGKASPYEAAVRGMLGGDAGGGSKKKSGKSDAEKDAEHLADAIARMNAQMAEQIALFGQTTEVAKLRYDLENGELAKASTAEKEQLLRKAAILDQLKLEADETERLNKLDEERREQIERAHTALADTFSDLQFEIDLLGKSNAERMAEIELRRIGIGLTDQERDAARDRLQTMAQELDALHEQISAMDEVRGSFQDIGLEVATHQKTLLEGLVAFADAFVQQMIRMAMAQASVSFFGEQGTTGGGLIGGFFSALFGGGSSSSNDLIQAFGGGLDMFAGGTDSAPGGWAIVGEEGPELVNLPRGAEVIPARESRRMAGGQTIHFHDTYRAPVDPRTRDQIAKDKARQLRTAAVR